MSKKVYQIITEKIIEGLKRGQIPWKQPFKTGIAKNLVTGKPYRGLNVLLLGL